MVNERFISPFRGTYNDNDLRHVTLYAYLKAFRFTGSPVLYLECEIHMCQSACPVSISILSSLLLSIPYCGYIKSLNKITAFFYVIISVRMLRCCGEAIKYLTIPFCTVSMRIIRLWARFKTTQLNSFPVAFQCLKYEIWPLSDNLLIVLIEWLSISSLALTNCVSCCSRIDLRLFNKGGQLNLTNPVYPISSFLTSASNVLLEEIKQTFCGRV